VANLVGTLPGAEAVSTLRGAGLAASAVNSVADLVREPHCWSRGDLLRLAHPEMGEIVTQGIVPSLSRTPGRVAGWSREPGSDNEAVLGGLLGYTADRIRELRFSA
jgi:formyl-CoA transferase